MADISTVLISQFSDMLHVEAQQLNSRVMGRVQVVPIKGESFFYDGLNKLGARIDNTRNPLSNPSAPQFNRRKMTHNRIIAEVAIDQRDIRDMMSDPKGALATQCIAAIHREVDRQGVVSALASVYTGADGSTLVTAANDGVQTINATGGMTYEIMRQISRKFMNYDVGLENDEKLMFFGTADEHDDLLGETEFISNDYTAQMVVDNGRLMKAFGIDIILFGASVDNPILTVNTATRDCIAMSNRGLVYGLSSNIKVNVINNHPKYVETDVIQVVMDLGSVRTEGVLVQKVQTTVKS